MAEAGNYDIPKVRGIYCIKNILTDTVYYGQASNIRKRLNRHIRELTTNEHDNIFLQNAWNKYGKDNFTLGVVEIVEDTQLNLTILEKKYYDSTDNRYNLLDPIAPTSWTGEMRLKASKRRLGMKATPETRLKMSLSQKGKKRVQKENFTRKKRQPASLETSMKMSESQKGNKNALNHIVSNKIKEQWSVSKKGKILSEETKQKLSEAFKGEKNPNFGKVPSEETRQKLVESHKGKIPSEETRKKLSEAITKVWLARKKAGVLNE